MCRDCGCEQGNQRAFHHDHDGLGPHAHGTPPGTGKGPHAQRPQDQPHSHSHDHSSAHQHDHATGREAARIRRIELERRVLARNDEAAARNRTLLAERGIAALNLISSPGSGKTALLEATLEGLDGRLRCAVIVGDQQTDNDARRLAGRGAPVLQIETRNACHLSAEQVGAAMREVLEEDTELLLVENVGNLVCPAAFDLGEGGQVALLSVTEGEDKPLKYPVLFHGAKIVLITKTDLLPHLDWDRDAALSAIRGVNPEAEIIETSARTGEGIGRWLELLEGLCRSVASEAGR